MDEPSAPEPSPRLDDKRFVIVTGKGGVGKTTVCAAQALALAKQGKRVLVCMCNTKERLSAMLGSAPIGPEVAQVAERVWAVNMDPDVALEEYGVMTLKSRSLYKLLFDNPYVRTFFRAVPGIQEWSLLGKAWWHTTEEADDGSFRYDVVILDAPATGHGLDMLRVPKVILDVVPPGLLRRDAERAWELFKDPATCAIVLVTLPEEMPTTETLELSRVLRTELGLPIGKVIVNCVLPRLFSPGERDALEGLRMDRPPNPVSSVDAIVMSGRRRALREGVQAAAIERLTRELPVVPCLLPQLFEDAAQPHAIRQLAQHVG